MNKNFQLVSDLLRGQWLIYGEWAYAHLPLVAKILNGDSLDAAFGPPISDAPLDDPSVYSVYEGVAMITISGPLTKSGGWCSYGTNDYIALLQAAFSDDSVRGVLLRVDSPGGSIAAIDTFYSMVESRNKPVVALIEDLAASAGYYMISGCDYIMLSNKTSMAGSIGVMVTIRDYSAQLEALGVKTRDLYSDLSPNKNIEDRALDQGDDKPMVGLLNKMAVVFQERVVSGRSGKLATEGEDPLDGGVFIGQDAIDRGLADEIGSLEAAFDKVVELSSASGSVNFSINNNVNMFGDKYPKLTALRGVAAADVTVEMLNAINAQLSEKGITGVLAVRQDWVEEAEGYSGQIATLTSEIATLKTGKGSQETKVTDLEAQIQTLTAERDEWQAKAVQFGAKPATEPAKPIKKEEKIEGTEAGNKNPFLCQADLELAALKQRAQLN